MRTLGIDTSNYTTSVCVYDSETDTVVQKKLLLPVKEGEKGLRQSDAVFHHTARLYPLVEELFAEYGGEIDAIGVSEKPRDAEGSYMPCFLVGVNVARSIGAVTGKPVYGFSHQSGHIAAALYSSGRMNLINQKFIAFHVSGGTSEMLLVSPDGERAFDVDIIGETLDLNCGQAVDRAGVMMGLRFPCGKELEALALGSGKKYNPKVCVNSGNCSLSGLENQCRKMLDSGESKEDVARYCLDFVCKTLEKMTEYSVREYGNLPLLFAGGVMSNSIIREKIQSRFGASFAEPEFSCDNAAGVAILASLKGKCDE
ncbi:MAG: peptidase M22 [Acutalibacteraceae bacterium]|nr:peptidase M22 [Acutalibacteraceae bacterium]